MGPKTVEKPEKRSILAKIGPFRKWPKGTLLGAPYRPLFSTGCVAMPTGGPGLKFSKKNPRESEYPALGPEMPVFKKALFHGASQTCLFRKKVRFLKKTSFGAFFGPKTAVFDPFSGFVAKPHKSADFVNFDHFRTIFGPKFGSSRCSPWSPKWAHFGADLEGLRGHFEVLREVAHRAPDRGPIRGPVSPHWHPYGVLAHSRPFVTSG